MISSNKKAILLSGEYQKTFLFKSIELLTLDVSYLQIDLENNLYAKNRINKYYKYEASHFVDYAATELRKNAFETYLYTSKNNFPFFAFEAVMKYYVSLNEACKLSTYSDQYQYSGGAHGNTVRSSINWNLNAGTIIKMETLFYNNQDYVPLVIDQIIKLANKQISENQYLYFDNYKELIVKNFNSDNFYLKPTSLTIFYQQYEIGPYASGIIEFDIPYHNLGLSYPQCLPIW